MREHLRQSVALREGHSVGAEDNYASSSTHFSNVEQCSNRGHQRVEYSLHVRLQYARSKTCNLFDTQHSNEAAW